MTRSEALLIALLTIAIAVGGSFAVTTLRQSVAGGSSTTPAIAPQPDLLSVFNSNPDRAQAKADCLAFGTLCDAMANVWEFDGQAKTPRLSRQSHLAELRQVAREYRLGGQSLAAKYPALPGVLDRFLGDVIPSGKGTGAVEVTSEVRARWVESHRKLAESAKWAGGQL